MDNKEQLTIKHIAPYLPYDVKCIYDNELCVLQAVTTDNEIRLCGWNRDAEIYWIPISKFKPHLRPLSDLTKEIEVNGERFVPMLELMMKALIAIYGETIEDAMANMIEVYNHDDDDISVGVHTFMYDDEIEFKFKNEGNWRQFYLFIQGSEMKLDQFSLFQKLYEWHFAIDIPEHLYIDLNTLQK